MDDLFYRKKPRLFSPRALLRRVLHNPRLMILLVVGIPLALYLLFGSRGIVQRFRLQAQKTDLQVKIHEQEREIQRLRAEIKALETDTRAIEKVARERYQMVREGETLYLVDTLK
jgi:cell division protein FtsB